MSLISPSDARHATDVETSIVAITTESSTLVRSIQELLERVEYRRCDSGEDFEAICRLRYKSYRSHGFVPVSPMETTTDQMDELPNCYRFGVYIDGELVSTLRVHHISASTPWGPAMSVFGDILEPRLKQGATYVNPSLLAADPDQTQSTRLLPFVTLRVGIAATGWFNSSDCIVLIRKEHAAFYRRVFMADQVGPAKTYPPFTVPVMMYGMDCHRSLATLYRRFPFFQSTEAERRMLFARPAVGEPAPLTILPTARYFSKAA